MFQLIGVVAEINCIKSDLSLQYNMIVYSKKLES